MKTDRISNLQSNINFPANGNGMFIMKDHYSGCYANVNQVVAGESVTFNDPDSQTLWTAANSVIDGIGLYQ
jgi:hypothetical protein